MFLKSADYWHRAPVPQRIYESLGLKMKFLVMLRDPVDRLHSDYSFNVSPSKNSRKCYLGSNGPDIVHLSVANYIIAHMTVHFLVTL